LLVDVDINFTENIVEFSQSTCHVVMNDTNARMVLFVGGQTAERDLGEVNGTGRAAFVDI
jgi:hypothetical protein